MKMAIKDGQVLLAEVDSDHYMQIKARGLMKWNKPQKMLYGPATAEVLNFLSTIIRLPAPAEDLRQQLNRIEESVDALRMDPEPVPLYEFPITKKLYKHQIRGVNMALLSFGLVDPPQERKKA